MPAWSPDGTKIVFVMGAEGDSEIYVMNANGSNPIRLTNNDNSDVGPDWQPINIAPVGGILIDVNKNTLLTPYLVLVGLAAAIAALVVVRKRIKT